jgi:hypothetical protein
MKGALKNAPFFLSVYFKSISGPEGLCPEILNDQVRNWSALGFPATPKAALPTTICAPV